MAIKVRRSKSNGDGPEDEQDGSSEGPEEAPVEPAGGDPFLRGSTRTLHWLSNNRNKALGGVAVLVVVGIAAYITYNTMQQQQVEASSAVSEAITAFEKPVQGSPAIDQILQSTELESLDETYESREAKWTAVQDEASKALETYSDNPVAQQARLMRAAASIRLDNYEQAISDYQAYLDNEPKKENLAIVHYGLGIAQGAAGKIDAATQSFDKVAENDEDLEDLALYQKGILQQEAGNAQKAKKLYEKLLEESPKSPYTSDVERRLALM
jgi:tetratricopeptide (TPR) repeat protein